MVFPLVPTIIILSLCGGIVASFLAFRVTGNIKTIAASGLGVFGGGMLLLLESILQRAG